MFDDDMLELKGDIFVSDVIFCWRSSEKGGTARPWEAQNWEAEPWFFEEVVDGGWWRGREDVDADGV